MKTQRVIRTSFPEPDRAERNATPVQIRVHRMFIPVLGMILMWGAVLLGAHVLPSEYGFIPAALGFYALLASAIILIAFRSMIRQEKKENGHPLCSEGDIRLKTAEDL